METLVAYQFDEGGPERAAAGLRRLEAYYGDQWQGKASRFGYDDSTIGMHLWDRIDTTSRWPTWYESDGLLVASLYVPLGVERITGELPPEKAPAALAKAVLQQPSRLLQLAPPFVLAVLEPEAEQLNLFTDSIGVGRLFQLRLEDGWVWSNRPAAALLFGDVPAVPSRRGWQYASGSSWFMDDTTPYERVLTVQGATHINVKRDRRTVSRTEVSSIWSGRGDVDETAQGLVDVARTVSRMWPDKPTVDLSGGRDSRVVAAAFLAAGVDLRLNSYDAVPGEIEVAKQLGKALTREVEHTIAEPAAPTGARATRKVELVERALRWHRYSEGLRAASYLFHVAPSLSSVNHLAIGGAGGEVAHGHFYPGDVLTLDALPLEEKLKAFVGRLQARLVPAAGPNASTRAAVGEQLERVLREAVRGGFENATMLDYFYLVERLRRWGTTGERTGVVSPLLIPSFVRGAFAMNPSERIENALHRDLVRRLVPEWADIPFFKAAPPALAANPTAGAVKPPVQPKRLADAADRDAVEELILGGSITFDPHAVKTLWTASVAGASSAAAEAALRQLFWQATFEQHVNEINQYLSTFPPPRPKPTPIPDGTPGPNPTHAKPARPPVHPLTRSRAVRALGKSPAWQSFRRTTLGSSWRSLSRRKPKD